MTLPTEFIAHIAGILEQLGIPYHVGGSVASSAHGLYRASADVDVVIDPTPERLGALAHALESEFYVNRSAMAEALAQHSTFNAIHDVTSRSFWPRGTRTRCAAQQPGGMTHAESRDPADRH